MNPIAQLWRIVREWWIARRDVYVSIRPEWF